MHRPGEVGVDWDAVDGDQGAALAGASVALQVLDLPPDPVRGPLDEEVRLQARKHRDRQRSEYPNTSERDYIAYRGGGGVP